MSYLDQIDTVCLFLHSRGPICNVAVTMALYVMCATDTSNTTKFAWKPFQTAHCSKICHLLTKLTVCLFLHSCGPICNVAVTVALYVMCGTDTPNTTKFPWKLFQTAYYGKICHILTKLTLFACICIRGPICNMVVTMALYVTCATDTSNTTKFAWKPFQTAHCSKICHLLTKLTVCLFLHSCGPICNMAVTVAQNATCVTDTSNTTKYD